MMRPRVSRLIVHHLRSVAFAFDGRRAVPCFYNDFRVEE